MPRLGPYSRASILADLDGRSRAARLLRVVRADLVAHCGGNPSATQRRLLEVAARLSLFVATLDAKTACGAPLIVGEADSYLRGCLALTQTLRDLGTHGTAPNIAAGALP